jgi:chemotaxis protein CheX
MREERLANSEQATWIAQMVDKDSWSQPLESFIKATVVALAEMASTEVTVQEVYQATLESAWGDISAVLRIKSATEGILVLSFPERTAVTIARQVIADAREQINESLVRDCVGEIANVIAGQAKTLLGGTSHQFTFSLPQVVVANSPPSLSERRRDCLVIAFRSALGEFAMRLALQLSDS